VLDIKIETRAFCSVVGAKRPFFIDKGGNFWGQVLILEF